MQYPLPERIPLLQPRSNMVPRPKSSLRKTPGFTLGLGFPLPYFKKNNNICSIHYPSGSRCFSRGHAWSQGPSLHSGKLRFTLGLGFPLQSSPLFPSKKTVAVSITRVDPDASVEVIHGPKTQVFTEENSRVYPGTWLPSSLL